MRKFHCCWQHNFYGCWSVAFCPPRTHAETISEENEKGLPASSICFGSPFLFSCRCNRYGWCQGNVSNIAHVKEPSADHIYVSPFFLFQKFNKMLDWYHIRHFFMQPRTATNLYARYYTYNFSRSCRNNWASRVA